MLLRLGILSVATCWVAWLYACGPQPCTPGAQRPCGNGVGQCQGAMQTCSPSGSWGLCDKIPSAELCDGVDNDCDGLIDEDALESLPGIDPVVPGPVEFVEAVGDYFLVGGVAPSLVDAQKERIWVALYDATGARLGELDLADPVNVGDKVRAAVAPSGDRAIVTRVVPQTAPVYAALLELDLDPLSPTFGTISDLVSLDEPAVTSLEVPTPDLAIPVFDDSVANDQLVLFVMDNMGGSQGDLVALRYDVNTLCGNSDVLCPPVGPVNVVQNVLRDDFVVMAPTDPTMDFVLGYFLSTTLYLTHVPRDTLLADPGGRTITSFPLIPELAAGPGGAALLAYRSQSKLTISRFEADTFECTGNPSVFVESCPQELGDTGGERPSAAYWPGEQAWLVGDKETAQGWGVRQVRASDGEVLAELMEPNPNAVGMHLAVSTSDLVLTSKSNDGTQNPSLVRPLSLDVSCPGTIRQGGPDSVGGKDITRDQDGSTVVAGEFGGSVTLGAGAATVSLTTRGSYDGFIAKYDQSGVLAWVRQLGGSGYDYARSVATDQDGNVIVTGGFQGTITIGEGQTATTLTSDGGVDVFVAKYDAQGVFQWAKQSNGWASNDPLALGVADDGSSVITGVFGLTVTFGEGPAAVSLTSTGTNSNDVFVAKYDASGNLIWAKRAGGTGSDWGWGVAIDPGANTLVVGDFTGTAQFGEGQDAVVLTAVGERDVFVAKYDPSGDLVWAIRAGGPDIDSGYADLASDIATDQMGNSLITGYFYQSATFGDGAGSITLSSEGEGDIFIAKYSPSGDLLWAEQAGGPDRDVANAVATDDAGNAFVTGNIQGTATFGQGAQSVSLNSEGYGDAFIAAYDANGVLRWATIAGGPEWDLGKSVWAEPNGSALALGGFQGTARFGEGGRTVELVSQGGYDLFIASYDSSGVLRARW